MKFTKLFVIAGFIMACSFFNACQDSNDHLENAGQHIKEAGEDLKDAGEDVVHETEQAIDNLKDDLEK